MKIHDASIKAQAIYLGGKNVYHIDKNVLFGGKDDSGKYCLQLEARYVDFSANMIKLFFCAVKIQKLFVSDLLEN